MADTALLIIDVQNDFCPGGLLPVPEGDSVVPVINRYVEQVRQAGGVIYASRDWHPLNTRHFRAAGGPWPPHCVQGTGGAAFHPRLELPTAATVITKGDNALDDGYSAFDGRDPQGQLLNDSLHARGIRRLLVGGLATDYCVRASALDGLKNGFDVVLLLDAIRGIELKEGDVARALDTMIRAGARTATLESVPQELAPA
jgi:nicotinamidase/pyrazinamidase